MQFKNLTDAAKPLARNPLGIIALFIVTVYAIGGLVINFAKPDFYQNPYHPSVIFLAIFPLCVLLIFTYLVSKHHEKLYGPSDYANQADFIKTFSYETDKGIRISMNEKETQNVLKDFLETFFDSYEKLLNNEQKSLFLKILNERKLLKVDEVILNYDRSNPEHIGRLRALRGLGLIKPHEGGSWTGDTHIEITQFGEKITRFLNEKGDLIL